MAIWQFFGGFLSQNSKVFFHDQQICTFTFCTKLELNQASAQREPEKSSKASLLHDARWEIQNLPSRGKQSNFFYSRVCEGNLWNSASPCNADNNQNQWEASSSTRISKNARFDVILQTSWGQWSSENVPGIFLSFCAINYVKRKRKISIEYWKGQIIKLWPTRFHKKIRKVCKKNSEN